MAAYDDYVWRLFSVAPQDVHDVVLPKDLEWTDEFTWSPLSQEVTTSLGGSIFVNQYKMLTGRDITLEGKDDMGWISRVLVEKLLLMRNTTGLIMTLNFCSATHNSDTDAWTFGTIHKSYKVMFRHHEVPIEFGSVKGFDNFEADSWFKVAAIRLMEVGNTDPTNPCV